MGSRLGITLFLVFATAAAAMAQAPPAPAAPAAPAQPLSAFIEPGVLPGSWMSGGPRCMGMPAWQVHEYNPNFFILRQSGCIHYEKPFLYLIALALGNAMALDFMERVFAARDGRTARRGCYYSASMTFVIGACVAIIGLAAVASVQGIADPRMLLPMMAGEVLPYWIGVMVFIGVLGASMSTANGAILVISVVLARNVIQRWRPTTDDSKLLRLSRLMALPTAAVAALLAYVRPEPGILLILAFDIVLAGCVIPLFAGVYWQKANSAGAVGAIVVGTLARLVAHYVTPAAWAGLDTLVPPVLSAVTFYVICQLTWRAEESRHYMLQEAVQEAI